MRSDPHRPSVRLSRRATSTTRARWSDRPVSRARAGPHGAHVPLGQDVVELAQRVGRPGRSAPWRGPACAWRAPGRAPPMLRSPMITSGRGSGGHAPDQGAELAHVPAGDEGQVGRDDREVALGRLQDGREGRARLVADQRGPPGAGPQHRGASAQHRQVQHAPLAHRVPAQQGDPVGRGLRLVVARRGCPEPGLAVQHAPRTGAPGRTSPPRRGG